MKQRRLRSLLGAALFPLALVSGVPQVHAQAGVHHPVPAFADGGVMDRKYAGKNPANPNCTGDNVSPALAWSDVPAGTTSLALIVSDPQGAGGQGVNHWMAYGISPADRVARARAPAMTCAWARTPPASRNTSGRAAARARACTTTCSC